MHTNVTHAFLLHLSLTEKKDNRQRDTMKYFYTSHPEMARLISAAKKSESTLVESS